MNLCPWGKEHYYHKHWGCRNGSEPPISSTQVCIVLYYCTYPIHIRKCKCISNNNIAHLSAKVSSEQCWWTLSQILLRLYVELNHWALWLTFVYQQDKSHFPVIKSEEPILFLDAKPFGLALNPFFFGGSETQDTASENPIVRFTKGDRVILSDNITLLALENTTLQRHS